MLDRGAKLKVLRSIKIEVKSDLKALDEVLSQFNTIYHDSIPIRDWLQCRLALAEGFTNAVRHAHNNLPRNTPIGIKVSLNQATIRIEIWDRGLAFDLQGFIAERTQKNADWLASGRGIPLLNKIGDRLDYCRTEQQQNCLIIVKKLTRQ